MTASITVWNRLEPLPRAPDLEAPARVEVRDPLWFLARQWQVGEFQAEDAATPASVEVSCRLGRLKSWAPEGSATYADLKSGEYIEPQVYGSGASTVDSLARAELGAKLSDLLAAKCLELRLAPPTPEESRKIAQAWPQAAPVGQEDPDDPETVLAQASRELFADGWAIASLQARGSRLPLPAPAARLQAAWDSAVSALVAWMGAQPGRFDLRATVAVSPWQPARQTARIAAEAALDAGGKLVFSWESSPDGAFRPQNCQLAKSTRVAPPASSPADKRIVRPAHLRFAGMPASRWWDLEGGRLSFADWVCDKTDLARATVADFLLQGCDDWFVIPLEMEHGQVCEIESIKVTDSFGKEWTYTTPHPGAQARSPFSIAGSPAHLLLAPSARDHAHGSRVEESVGWKRDEQANLVWARPELRPGSWGSPRELRFVSIASTRLDSPVTGANRFILRLDPPPAWCCYAANDAVSPLARQTSPAPSRLLDELASIPRTLAGSTARQLRFAWVSTRGQLGPAAWPQRERAVSARGPVLPGWRFDALKASP